MSSSHAPMAAGAAEASGLAVVTQPRLLRSACRGWAGLGSSSPPGNTVGNKEPLFAVAELGWPHALSPRGRDAARLGCCVLLWVLSVTVSPSLPCQREEWDAL